MFSMQQKYGFSNNLRYTTKQHEIMAAPLKIRIPKPCHEDWNAMTPNQQGRFCNNCSKSVIDFTKMKTPEIQDYFIRNQDTKVCGKFNNSQLESIRINIPMQMMFSQTQFHKIFLLALLVTMGTTLISCSDNNGNKQSIDSIEVLDDREPFVTMGVVLQTDSISIKDNLPETPPKKYTKPNTLKGAVEVVPIDELENEIDSTETMGKTHIDTIP
jgi:hypothetical protein